MKKFHLILAPLVPCLVFFLTNNFPLAARITATVFTLVIILWITELIPLYVSAILGPFLLMLSLDPLAPIFKLNPIPFKLFLAPFGSPVIVLMAGGFFMALIFTKYRLDIEFSNFILSKLGKKTSVILFGIISLTAFLSMWMSNTATTAIMVATMIPVVKKLPDNSNIAKSIMLSIPFAANIGGIATPIGTPPNAISIGILANMGNHISFIRWMYMGFPIMIVLLITLFFLMIVFFPHEEKYIKLETKQNISIDNSKRLIVYGTFLLTITLWLTDFLHHIPSALVAIIPFLIFSFTGLSGKRDLREISWEILLLIGGGISMGLAIEKTGLSSLLLSHLNPGVLSPLAAAFILCFSVAILATFMSHTASANLVIPIAASLSFHNPIFLVISVALSASYGMALPVSTPPNAIAYSSELISIKDMIKIGGLITLFGVLITVFYQYYFLLIFKI